MFDNKVSRNSRFESVIIVLLGKCEPMSHIKIWLTQWITWQSNFLDSDLSVECQDVKCPHVGHHSLVIVTADDTWRISGPCHAVTSESWHSGRGVAALYWRRHPASPGLRWPQSPALGLGARCTHGPGRPTDSHGGSRGEEGGSPAWSCNQAERVRERDWCRGRLSEESLSGLGAEKPGPYKEVLVRNGEKNGSIK